MPLHNKFSEAVSVGETIDAENIRERFEKLEGFVNGGIDPHDIKYAALHEAESAGVTLLSDPRTDAFETRHILRPEYYISANPRVEGVSSDTYYRNVPDGKMNRHIRHETSGHILTENLMTSDINDLPADAWQPVDGMSATVMVKGDSNVDAYVCGSCYAWGSGATDFYGMSLYEQAQNYSRGDLEGLSPSESQWSAWWRAVACNRTIGIFKLWVDRPDVDEMTDYRSTERRLYGRGERSYRSRRSQLSFATKVTLSPGINKISYRCVYRLTNIDTRLSQHLYIDNRNFFVDVHYK